MITNLFMFVVAAFFEIAGCFAFWVWLRRGASLSVALLGIVSLIAFAVALTRVHARGAFPRVRSVIRRFATPPRRRMMTPGRPVWLGASSFGRARHGCAFPRTNRFLRPGQFLRELRGRAIPAHGSR